MKQTENDDYNNNDNSRDGSRWGSAVFNAPVTFQGPMFHIHDNDHVEEHIHYHYPVSTDGERKKTAATATPGTPPAGLDTEEARLVMERLVKAGLLDEAWQPAGLSGARRGVLAQRVAARLGVTNTWKAFGALWGMNDGTLRTAYNKGMDQPGMGDFIEQIRKALQ